MDKISTEQQTGAEIVKAFFEAFGQRDLSAVDRYFAPDVDYIVIGANLAEAVEAIPWLGQYSGREGAKEFISHLQSNIDILGFSPQEIIQQGDSVAVFGRFDYRARSTGAEFASDYAIHIKLRGGLIAYYHFYENTYAVAAAFRRAGSWELDTDGKRKLVP